MSFRGNGWEELSNVKAPPAAKAPPPAIPRAVFNSLIQRVNELQAALKAEIKTAELNRKGIAAAYRSLEDKIARIEKSHAETRTMLYCIYMILFRLLSEKPEANIAEVCDIPDFGKLLKDIEEAYNRGKP